MVTREQLDIFKLAHDGENARSQQLTKQAELYLTTVALVVAAVFIKLDTALEVARRSGLNSVLWASLCAMFLGGAVCAIVSLLLRSWEGPLNPTDAGKARVGKGGLKDGLNDATDAAFADVSAATQQDSRQNNKRATWLKIAAVLVLVGFVCAFGLLIAAALSSPEATKTGGGGAKHNKPAAGAADNKAADESSVKSTDKDPQKSKNRKKR